MQEIITGKWVKLKEGQKQKISLSILVHSLQFV
jgi:hypothetical protein